MRLLIHSCGKYVEDWNKPFVVLDNGALVFAERAVSSDDVDYMSNYGIEYESPPCGAPDYIGYLVDPNMN